MITVSSSSFPMGYRLLVPTSESVLKIDRLLHELNLYPTLVPTTFAPLCPRAVLSQRGEIRRS
jgi:hypothetical protein